MGIERSCFQVAWLGGEIVGCWVGLLGLEAAKEDFVAEKEESARR